MSAGTRRDESEGEEELEVTDGELAVELWNDEGVNPATGEVYGYGMDIEVEPRPGGGGHRTVVDAVDAGCSAEALGVVQGMELLRVGGEDVAAAGEEALDRVFEIVEQREKEGAGASGGPGVQWVFRLEDARRQPKRQSKQPSEAEVTPGGEGAGDTKSVMLHQYEVVSPATIRCGISTKSKKVGRGGGRGVLQVGTTVVAMQSTECDGHQRVMISSKPPHWVSAVLPDGKVLLTSRGRISVDDYLAQQQGALADAQPDPAPAAPAPAPVAAPPRNISFADDAPPAEQPQAPVAAQWSDAEVEERFHTYQQAGWVYVEDTVNFAVQELGYENSDGTQGMCDALLQEFGEPLEQGEGFALDLTSWTQMVNHLTQREAPVAVEEGSGALSPRDQRVELLASARGMSPRDNSCVAPAFACTLGKLVLHFASCLRRPVWRGRDQPPAAYEFASDDMDVEQGALLEDEGRPPSQREEMQRLQVRNKELLHKNAELERQVLNGAGTASSLLWWLSEASG